MLNPIAPNNATGGLPSNIEYIDVVPLTTPPPYKEGRFYFDANEDAFTVFGDSPNTSLQVGQELWVRAKNATGSTIADGSVVYISGAVGASGVAEVSLANASDYDTAKMIGMATENIADGDIGAITVVGKIRGINTATFAEGALLYLSASASGGLTDTRPMSPNYSVPVCVCINSHATNGAVVVLPSTPVLGPGENGGICFYNASGEISHDEANFFWDDANNRLGLGTQSPSSKVNVKSSGNTSSTSNLKLENSDGLSLFEVKDDGLLTHRTDFRDLIATFTAAKTGGNNDPTFKNFSGGIYVYAFPSNFDKELFTTLHFNHDIKPGSVFFPHIHWAPEDAQSGVVRWGIEYTIARGHGQEAFPASQTIYLEQDASGVAKMHQIVESSSGISFSNLEPDTVVLVRVFRDGIHANDTYPADAFGFLCDFHYQSDREGTKNKSPDFNS